MDDPGFYLPYESYDAIGVPAHMRSEVSAVVAVAKYCALVEAVLKLTGGKPIEVNLERVKEILAMNHLTDPREMVMIAERKPNGDPGPLILVDLATPEEVREANRRFALHRMGGRRN